MICYDRLWLGVDEHSEGIEMKCTEEQRHRVELLSIAMALRRYAMISRGFYTEKEFENMETVHVRLTFTEDVLGTANADKKVHSEFIASKAPDAPSREEEVAALGADEVEHKEMSESERNALDTYYWVLAITKEIIGAENMTENVLIAAIGTAGDVTRQRLQILDSSGGRDGGNDG